MSTLQQENLNKNDLASIFSVDNLTNIVTGFDRNISGEYSKFQNIVNIVIQSNDINASNTAGRTLLTMAAYFENIELAKKLLALGANPLQLDRVKLTPLDWTMDNGGGSPKCCDLLMGATYQKLLGQNNDKRNIEDRIQGYAEISKFLEKLEKPLQKSLLTNPAYQNAYDSFISCKENLKLLRLIPKVSSVENDSSTALSVGGVKHKI